MPQPAAPASTPAWRRQPRPLVIAHRGASHDAAENSLAAFRLAREQGADAVELDVMRCGSGEVVVFHDDDLERLGGRADRVRRAPLDLLRTINLGDGERIPLLDEALDATAPLLVNIELKTAPGWAARVGDDGLATQVAAAIARHHAEARVLVSSFDPMLLLRFARRAPGVPTGLLFGAKQSRPLKRAWAAPLVRPAALHPEAPLVDAVELDRWRAHGRLVHVWTVDDAAEVRALAALGVDAVITNRPALARSVLAF